MGHWETYTWHSNDIYEFKVNICCMWRYIWHLICNKSFPCPWNPCEFLLLHKSEPNVPMLKMFMPLLGELHYFLSWQPADVVGRARLVDYG